MMQNKELTYRVLTYSDSDSVVNLCKRFNIYLKNNLIQKVCAKKWDDLSTDCIGYGCFDKNQLIGYIGSIQAHRNELIVNDLTCGIVDDAYRGNGIATKLFTMANADGDIVLDLTPSEQVYQMYKRHFPQFKDLSEYQLWFNCKKLKKNNNLVCVSEINEIINAASDVEKKLIRDNSKLMMSFALIKLDNESTIIGYYTMKKKKIIKGFEIIYISNRLLFEKHFEAILKSISKINKSFFAFVDKRWLPIANFEGNIMPRGTNSKQYIKRMSKLCFKKYIKAPNRKLVCFNNGHSESMINMLDYLYTEMSLYKDLN